jgi:hypothetical protein
MPYRHGMTPRRVTGENRDNAFPHFLTRASPHTACLLGRRTYTADRKSAGTSGVLEAPVIVGGPSRTRTLDPLIKSRVQKRTQRNTSHHDVENPEASAS